MAVNKIKYVCVTQVCRMINNAYMKILKITANKFTYLNMYVYLLTTNLGLRQMLVDNVHGNGN